MITATSLRGCPPGRPSAAQVDAAAAAEALARHLLGSLPGYVLRWTRGGPVRGETEFTEPIIVRLSDELETADVYGTVLHELHHVADHALVGRLSREELERRARGFAARAMKESPMPTTATPNGHTDDARRQALAREGHAIANRAERARRRFTAEERRRANEILAELGEMRKGPSPAPLRQHLGCGGIFLRGAGGASWCARCGAIRFGD